MRTLMKCPSVLLIALALIWGSYAANAQSAPGPQNQVTEFDVNGLKVLVKRRPGTPTVAAGLYFRGGVRNMTSANAGIENLTLNVATEATKSFPRQRLRKETARIGTAISAASGFDYSALALACTKGNFDISWQIFTDVALNPAFDPADVTRIKENLLTLLRSENDSPEGSLDSLNQKIIFAGHPYSVDPQGTVSTVSGMKAEDLSAYHKKMLQTSQMLLVIVGDLDPDAIQKRVAAAFGSLPRGNYKETALPPIPFQKGSLDIEQKPAQTNYVKGVFAAPSIADPDYYAMRTAITVLQQRVFQEVRVRRNLSYAPDAELHERRANTAAISVSAVNANEAISVMLNEIERLKKEPINQEDIGQMAAFFLTTYYLKQETNAAQVAELAQYELSGGGWRNSLLFLERIRKVTPSEIQAAAGKYMNNLRFVVVGNPADINRSIFVKG
jgi:zinc protease